HADHEARAERSETTGRSAVGDLGTDEHAETPGDVAEQHEVAAGQNRREHGRRPTEPVRPRLGEGDEPAFVVALNAMMRTHEVHGIEAPELTVVAEDRTDPTGQERHPERLDEPG